MIPAEIVGRLRATASLTDLGTATAFDEALGQVPAILTQQDIEELLTVFRDDTGSPEVMFGLVHRIEATALGVEERAVLAALPALHSRAPWWASVLVLRLANTDASRAALIEAWRGAPRDAQEALRTVLESITLKDDQAGANALRTLSALGA